MALARMRRNWRQRCRVRRQARPCSGNLLGLLRRAAEGPSARDQGAPRSHRCGFRQRRLGRFHHRGRATRRGARGASSGPTRAPTCWPATGAPPTSSRPRNEEGAGRGGAVCATLRSRRRHRACREGACPRALRPAAVAGRDRRCWPTRISRVPCASLAAPARTGRSCSSKTSRSMLRDRGAAAEPAAAC